jgi:GDP-4-dehydro-6-deoxy-D-mannose reductase
LRAQGDEAVVLDRSVPEAEGFSLDITDGAALEGVMHRERFDAVFHLAGLNAAAPRAQMEQVNVEGTRAVLKAVRGRGARVLVMSSSAVYGACQDDPITEESALAPATPYGASKVAAEALAQDAARQDWVAMARPFNIIGPGQRAPMLQTVVVSQLVAIERGAAEPVLKLGWLGNARDFIDVRDVAAGLVAIVAKGQSGQAYNLCSGEATKARALVERLVAMSNKTITIQDVKEKPSTTDVPYQRGSAVRLHSAAGWRTRIALTQSLDDSLAWQRRHG